MKPIETHMQQTEILQEVAPLRHASRQLVRELGFLEEPMRDQGVTHSQCHALIELDRNGVLTSKELAELLNLDKSTTSRVIGQLLDSKLVSTREDGEDKRRRPLQLTAKGKRKVEAIHSAANQQVNDALALLSEKERRIVLDGMSLYAKALSRLRRQNELAIRPIERKDDPEVAKIIRTVMTEFGASGPGFAIHDAEVDTMSRAYSGSDAGYYVVTSGERVVGGAGFASLAGADGKVCELRKMYFLPELRGAGMGRRLLLHVLAEAKAKGFERCYLETLKTMVQARNLYESVGFERIPCALGNTGHFSCDAFYAKPL
jgi:putative acetyltransferase